MKTPSAIGRYEVQGRLGQGGMGTLYLAHDPKIDRLVAIKVLHADFETDDMHARFGREARAVGALTYPNIVVIHDFGEFEGAPFIVMEYIQGRTLKEIISGRDSVTLVEKIRLLEQLCGGLAYAHRKGIIHRDVKPANLMVNQEGNLKILDFGIARMTEGTAKATIGTIGTPGYMSPEQIRGESLDGRSDLFSMGALAYELVSHRQAFPGTTYHTIMHRVLYEQPAPLMSFAPDFDAELEAVITQALEKNADDRYQDAQTAMRAFEHVRLRLERTGEPGGTLTFPATELLPLQPTLRTPRPIQAAAGPDATAVITRRPEGLTPVLQGKYGASKMTKVRDDMGDQGPPKPAMATKLAGAAAVVMAVTTALFAFLWMSASADLQAKSKELDRTRAEFAQAQQTVGPSDQTLKTAPLRVCNNSRKTATIAAVVAIYRDSSGQLRTIHSGSYDYPTWSIRPAESQTLSMPRPGSDNWDGSAAVYALQITYPNAEPFLFAGLMSEAKSGCVSLNLD